ncbi:hypothetical protein [Mycobacterium sp.]|uniref:hypothetical protein n=1 Tax=Mycobacterium sp. TaxID=1785 RepID=UPI002C2748D0|nr:hypothetical protein [Mycobacterium sp.]HTY31242.1 hypothetical protein [Mycobacterium sp.]
MPTVVILSGGLTGATMVENGDTYYLWGFTVNVDGQVYWTGVWVTGPGSNDPGSLSRVEAAVVDLLESEDPEQGLDGIAESDSLDDYVDESMVDAGDDDGDDSAVASADGGDYGDSV